MAKSGLKIFLEEGRQNLVIEMEIGGDTIGHVKYESIELADLMKQLAALRAKMPDPVPYELDPSPRLGVVIDAKHSVNDMAQYPGHTVLAFRHPGYGWIGFALDADRTRELAKQLTVEAPDKK